jgi:hypothetical protein
MGIFISDRSLVWKLIWRRWAQGQENRKRLAPETCNVEHPDSCHTRGPLTVPHTERSLIRTFWRIPVAHAPSNTPLSESRRQWPWQKEKVINWTQMLSDPMNLNTVSMRTCCPHISQSFPVAAPWQTSSSSLSLWEVECIFTIKGWADLGSAPRKDMTL